IPSAILYVNGIITIIKTAGSASDISPIGISRILCTIMIPTIIKIELIAVLGIIDIHGMMKIVKKNKILAVIAAILVFPLDAITAAFSADDTVGDVPINAHIKDDKAVA